MNKTLIIIIMAVLCLTAVYAVPVADSLYLKLHKQAQENLKNMPSYAKKDYTRLLKRYPDRLMAFLLAYEENGRLCAIDPKIIEDHYLSVKVLMREKGISQPDEFFLSYVAKITVSDEAITNYRRQFEGNGIYDKNYMFDGLGLKDKRQEIADELELYRLVCLKTTELLMYKPTSGRDLAPLDVASRSLVGRCEESQILFVALCRTVGIPARAASTPWWAHQDDNHAWAEVFLNGKWHYSGDADGGYWPNQTWFTGLSRKMVLVVADGSLPAKDDEVLSQDQYGATINSIRYYAGEEVRTLNIKVLDMEGKPVAKANLAIDVYNFYSLRPQANIQTDDKGEKTITVGQGAFFVMAFKDSLKTLQFVPSNQEKELSYTMRISKGDLPELEAVMKYPSYRPDFMDAPQSWKDNVKKAQEMRQGQLDKITDMATKEYFAKISEMTDGEFLDFMKSLYGDKPNYWSLELMGIYSYVRQLKQDKFPDSLFFEVMRKTRLNMHYWLGFDILRRYEYQKNGSSVPDISEKWLSVLLQNDEKDLWQANGWLFYRMYKWFEYIYPKVNYLPSDEQFNLFEPTVFYENLPWMSHYKWKESVSEGLYPKRMILKKPHRPEPWEVIRYCKKKHQVKPDKAVIGLLPLDIALYQKQLTGYQYKILACAYLRANQIPANYSRIPSVVSVYTDSTWKYFDLEKNKFYETDKGETPSYRKVEFILTDELGQPVTLKKEQVHISFYKDGILYPSNEQSVYKGNGLFETKVPSKGMFYAQIGYRNSDSLTVYRLQPLAVSGNPLDRIELTLRHFHQKWQSAEDFLKPVIEELHDKDYKSIILGNFNQENTIRLVNKLKSAERKFTVLGYEQSSQPDYDYLILPAYLELVKEIPSLQQRTITLIKDDKSGSWLMYEGLWDELP